MVSLRWHVFTRAPICLLCFFSSFWMLPSPALLWFWVLYLSAPFAPWFLFSLSPHVGNRAFAPFFLGPPALACRCSPLSPGLFASLVSRSLSSTGSCHTSSLSSPLLLVHSRRLSLASSGLLRFFCVYAWLVLIFYFSPSPFLARCSPSLVPFLFPSSLAFCLFLPRFGISLFVQVSLCSFLRFWASLPFFVLPLFLRLLSFRLAPFVPGSRATGVRAFRRPVVSRLLLLFSDLLLSLWCSTLSLLLCHPHIFLCLKF